MNRIPFGILCGLLVSASGAVENTTSPVTLTLEVDRASFAPFEPIPVKYEITNTGTVPISVPSHYRHDQGRLKFEIAGPDGQFRPYKTGLIGCGPFEATVLAPGERLAAEIHLLSNTYGILARGSRNAEYRDAKEFPFAEPGAYKVRATFPLASSRSDPEVVVLESNVLELSIRSASDEEREAFEFFSSPQELAGAVSADVAVRELPSALPRLEEFVARYPHSVYTPAVRLQLGRIYLNGTGMEQPDAARAATHFRAVTESAAPGLADDALLELAKSLIEGGRFDEARATLTRLLAEYPESEQTTEATRVRDGLGKGWRTLRDIYGD